MKEIPLTQGKVALVDDDDYDRVVAWSWHAYRGKNGVWYAKRTLNFSATSKTTIYMHREIVGRPDKSLEVDHADGDGLNNQKLNLRVTRRSNNAANAVISRTNNKSGYKGVHWAAHVCRWMARVGKERQRIYLGLFDTAEAAAQAYDREAIKLFGEFARTNFPKSTYE